MSRAYPVMSLSDEFYFLPRSSGALRYLDCLDSLNRAKINEDISYLRDLLRNLEKLDTKTMGLETLIDHRLLALSIRGFLQEFQQVKIWQHDPNLYLKIACLGIEQIVNKLAMIKKEVHRELSSRIRQIPRLLQEAKANLKAVEPAYRQAAAQTTATIIDYLKQHLPLFLKARGRETEKLKTSVDKAIYALEDFKLFLKRKVESENLIIDRAALEDLLVNSFSYKRNLKEIFEIACEEYQGILKELKKTSAQLQTPKSWQGILCGYKLKAKNHRDLLGLYSREISGLRDFLIRSRLVSIPGMQGVKVERTPPYLSALRASASYSCSLTKRKRESALFYVGIDSITENIHQEYIFVSAHETYPGHHLLDSIRSNLKNPIRRQIESPLFYEGWASYAENLIGEFGYIKDARQRLVGLRRQAWRAIRAKLDAGIRINKLKAADAANELCGLGYNPGRVKSMIGHYLLTYGYQLCYTIGKFEIERLRKRFVPRIGIRNFHDCLLGAGEIPFDLIEKRMEKLCGKNS
ncbi:DUF885 family protein [Candidatus Omnitrophota bacterium]